MRLKIQNDKSSIPRKTLSYALLFMLLLFARNSWAQTNCTFTIDSNAALVNATVTGTSTNGAIVPNLLFVGTITGSSSTIPKLYFAIQVDHNQHHGIKVSINNTNQGSTAGGIIADVNDRVCDGSTTIDIDGVDYIVVGGVNANKNHWEVFEFDLEGVTLPNGEINYRVESTAGGFLVDGKMELEVAEPKIKEVLTKTWVDDNNASNSRPSSINVQIKGAIAGQTTPDIIDIGDKYLSGSGNSWSKEFEFHDFNNLGIKYETLTADEEVIPTGYCKQINGLTVTNYLLPTITIAQSPTCYGQPATLTASHDLTSLFGGVAMSYQWQESTDSGTTWTDISGAIGVAYTIYDVEQTDLDKHYRIKFIPADLDLCVVESNMFEIQVDTTSCNAEISIKKEGVFNDVNNDGFAQTGETITYTFTVKNEGQIALTNVVVNDPLLGGNLTSMPTGDANVIGTLDIGETWIYTVTYSINTDDIFTAKGVSNTVSVTADSATGPVTNSDTIFVPLKGRGEVISNSMIYQKAK